MNKFLLVCLIQFITIKISICQLTEDKYIKLDSNVIEIKSLIIDNVLIDFLYFNSEEIFGNPEMPFSFSFHSHFKTIDGEDILLIQETAESAGFYFIMSIKNNNYWLSQEFGTRSDLFNIKFYGKKLIIELPERDDGGYKRYIYKNRKLSFSCH